MSNYFTREGLIYQEAKDTESEGGKESSKHSEKRGSKPRQTTEEDELKIHVLIAKKTTLRSRL